MKTRLAHRPLQRNSLLVALLLTLLSCLPAATSRAQAVTMAPGEAEISPPGGISRTSSAVTMSFMCGLAV